MEDDEAAEWVSCFIQQCPMQFPRCHKQTTAKSQLSISGKDCSPTFGFGWRRNPKPELFQPRSSGGADRCVGTPSSFTGLSGTRSPSSCGCRSPRPCGGCQGGRCQSWPRSTSRARRRQADFPSNVRHRASSQSQGPLIQVETPDEPRTFGELPRKHHPQNVTWSHWTTRVQCFANEQR